jgi:hypothetical protein
MSTDQDDKGTLYHIRVRGNLDPKWADWFEGFALSSHENGETLLSGKVADQAALHGLLGKINSLGISLIFVVKADHSYRGKYCPFCGHPLAIEGLSLS